MYLSIVIVNWNTREFLANCLSSLQLDISNLQNQPCWEVLVVDNASNDGSATLVKEQFTWVHLIENSENMGFARANNQALRLAKGRFILLLNSDTIIRLGTLNNMIDALKALPQAGAAGPQVFNPDGTIQNCYGSLPSVGSEIIGPYAIDIFTKPWGEVGNRVQKRLIADGNYKVVDRVSFACTMIRRTALDQVGLLDERFEFYSEDYDWFKRLKDAGWLALYCPQAKIVHHWGASSRQRSEWALRQLYRSKRRYFAKHSGPRAERLLRLGLALRFAAKIGVACASFPVRRNVALQQIRLNARLIQDMWSAI
jgi:N-acetylglucosaminyl-diphospho-decaprenol L-rhamnosyltransferase